MSSLAAPTSPRGRGSPPVQPGKMPSDPAGKAAVLAGKRGRAAITFTVTVDGEMPRRFRIAPGKRPVKVGRGPRNDIVVEKNGISAHHLDILAVEGPSGPVLAVRDTSMNGTGLQSAPGEMPLRLAKDANVEVLSVSVLIMPFKVKPVEGGGPQPAPEELRTILRVKVVNEATTKAEAESAAKRRKVTSAEGKKDDKAKAKAVEDMMARCRAFADAMEGERRKREAVGEVLDHSVPPPSKKDPTSRSATSSLSAASPMGTRMPAQGVLSAYEALAGSSGTTGSMAGMPANLQLAGAFQAMQLQMGLAGFAAMSPGMSAFGTSNPNLSTPGGNAMGMLNMGYGATPAAFQMQAPGMAPGTNMLPPWRR